MRKVIVYIAMSLDGYVADSNGGVSWLAGDGSDAENFGTYNEFIENIDTVLLGFSTYNQIVTELSPDAWPYEGMNSYVLTHRKMDNQNQITFTDENLVDLIKKLKSQQGKDIWICGGASLIQQLKELDLIDEYTFSIMPTILGKGVKLFAESDSEFPLALKNTTAYNGIAEVTYVPRRI